MTTCFINNEEFDVEFVKEDINLISVNSKTEIFFDVFDCKIKSKNIILEKIETRDNNDIVVLEVLYKGKKYITDAILIQGEKSFIKLNEKNLYLTNDNNVIKKNIEEKKEENKEVISEKKLQEINKINDGNDISSFLAESLSNYNNKKLNQKLKNYENIYNKKVDDFEDKKKEFLVTIENEFDKSIQNLNEEIDLKIQKYYENTNTSNKALLAVQSKKLKDSINEKYNSFIDQINNLKNFNKDVINGILEEKSQDIKDSLNVFLENLNTENKESFLKLLNEKIDSSENNINLELTELKNTVDNLSNNNILISKNNKNLFKETNKRFNDLNKKIKILSEKRNNEYNELLAAVNNKDVVEYKTILKEKIEEAELSNIKQEILKEVSGNFNNEIISMKRYAEASAGGGTNAVQYANGGTMNGDLNVTGTLLADTILATTLLSAVTLDIGFELSGFNVTGSISANGDITGNGVIANTLSAGDLTVNTNTLKVDATNNRVGINTIPTFNALEVNGDIKAAGVLKSSSSAPGLFLTDTDGTNLLTSVFNSDGVTVLQARNNNNNGIIDFRQNNGTTDPTTPMRIASNGRVGIGTTSPNEILHVEDSSSSSGTSITIQNAFGESPKNIKFRHTDTVETARIEGFGRNNTSHLPYLAFHVNQTTSSTLSNDVAERMRITSSGNVGINQNTPTEALDVTGNIKATGNLSLSSINANNITVTNDLSAGDIIKGNRLNIGGGKLYVDDGSSTGNAFVKMGAYGSGNFFGREGSVNGAAFSLGVGTAGKIVEDMRIDTFALSGAGLVNKFSNPVILVNAPGANKYIVPVSIQVYKSQSGGTRVPWGAGIAAFSLGTFATSALSGSFSQLTALPRAAALIDGDWLYNRNQGPNTQVIIHSNRALAFRTSTNIVSNGSDDVYYLKVRYMVMSEDGDFKSIGNLQIKDT
jgi:hypothetical protein